MHTFVFKEFLRAFLLSRDAWLAVLIPWLYIICGGAAFVPAFLVYQSLYGDGKHGPDGTNGIILIPFLLVGSIALAGFIAVCRFAKPLNYYKALTNAVRSKNPSQALGAAAFVTIFVGIFVWGLIIALVPIISSVLAPHGVHTTNDLDIFTCIGLGISFVGLAAYTLKRDSALRPFIASSFFVMFIGVVYFLVPHLGTTYRGLLQSDGYEPRLSEKISVISLCVFASLSFGVITSVFMRFSERYNFKIAINSVFILASVMLFLSYAYINRLGQDQTLGFGHLN